MELTINLGQFLEILALVAFLVSMYWRTNYLAKQAKEAVALLEKDLIRHETWGLKKQQEMVDAIREGFKKNVEQHKGIYEIIQKACNGDKIIVPNE